ncbi:unnamed protein product, partial [Cylicostephanus goldi]
MNSFDSVGSSAFHSFSSAETPTVSAEEHDCTILSVSAADDNCGVENSFFKEGPSMEIGIDQSSAEMVFNNQVNSYCKTEDRNRHETSAAVREEVERTTAKDVLKKTTILKKRANVVESAASIEGTGESIDDTSKTMELRNATETLNSSATVGKKEQTENDSRFSTTTEERKRLQDAKGAEIRSSMVKKDAAKLENTSADVQDSKMQNMIEDNTLLEQAAGELVGTKTGDDRVPVGKEEGASKSKMSQKSTDMKMTESSLGAKSKKASVKEEKITKMPSKSPKVEVEHDNGVEASVPQLKKQEEASGVQDDVAQSVN